jgi:sRNA-binding protein
MTTAQNPAAIIAELARLYPRAFFTDPSRMRPLTIGVKEMLLCEWKDAPDALGVALRYYTGGTSYLKVMIAGASRVDLQGRKAGLVTARHAKMARRRLAENDQAPSRGAAVSDVARPLAAINNPAFPAGASAMPGLSAAPAGSHRLGLADLKRAAAARRAAGI